MSFIETFRFSQKQNHHRTTTVVECVCRQWLLTKSEHLRLPSAEFLDHLCHFYFRLVSRTLFMCFMSACLLLPHALMYVNRCRYIQLADATSTETFYFNYAYLDKYQIFLSVSRPTSAPLLANIRIGTDRHRCSVLSTNTHTNNHNEINL